MPALVHYYDFVGNSTLRTPHSAVYSPITFNQGWPKMGRLLFFIAASFFSATMNGFFISSYFIDDSLKRIGNIYQACLGLADSLISCAVLPMVTVVLLSGQWDLLEVCELLHFMIEFSTYMYSLFFLLTAMENYFRLCRSQEEYDWFLSVRMSGVGACVCALATLLAGAGVYGGLDYDYCRRHHFGDPVYRLTTYTFCHAIPCFFTIFCLTASHFSVKQKAQAHANYRRSYRFDADKNIVLMNIVAYALYVSFWIPYLVVSLWFPAASDAIYYFAAWGGVARSVFTSCLFGLGSPTFRRAYGHLFYYCYCKASLAGTGGRRRRRCGADAGAAGGEGGEGEPAPHPPSVHVLHHALQSARRAAAPPARNNSSL